MPQCAYIHIPFCKKKCNYCAFVSYEKPSLIKDYVKKLIEEIRFFYKGEKLTTLYFGGGTPSLLDSSDITRILKEFNFSDSPEITVEVNPESADGKYLKELHDARINRLSIGFQTFDDEILKIIGRLHDSKRALQTYKEARNAGFNNISLDFIYGLPKQTLKNFTETLQKAVSLNPEHISLYGLKIEDGTIFAKKKPANLADGDLQADMYLKAIEILQTKYNHYEISNFAKTGFESRHNLNYWNNEEYYGFGISAHGYVDGQRYANLYDWDEYHDNPINKQESFFPTQEEQMQEQIFLGFRKTEGIDIHKINLKYSVDFNEKYKDILDKYLDSEHIIKTPKGYKLSTEGRLLSNLILCDFI